MAGLLADVLPWVFSKSDQMKRQVNSALTDPAAYLQQGVGLLSDSAMRHQATMNQAFADPANPFKVTDESAMMEAANNMLRGPLSFAPVGMIDKAALQAKYPSVDFSLGQSRDGGLATLSKVVVPPEQRGQGVGSAFMRDLTQAADADGAQLALSPASDFGGSKARLLDFYKRFGFVPNKGRNIDYEISESMYRTPKK